MNSINGKKKIKKSFKKIISPPLPVTRLKMKKLSLNNLSGS